MNRFNQNPLMRVPRSFATAQSRTRSFDISQEHKIALLRQLGLDGKFNDALAHSENKDFDALFKEVTDAHAFNNLIGIIRTKEATPALFRSFFTILGKDKINDYTVDGKTLLTAACKSKLFDCAEILFELGADPFVRNKNVYHRNAFDCRLSPDLLTSTGRPLLNQAIFDGDIVSINVLLDAGANPGLPNRPTINPLLFHYRLTQGGATDYSPVVEPGRNALTLALTLDGRRDLACDLLHGAFCDAIIDMPDLTGQRPLDIACATLNGGAVLEILGKHPNYHQLLTVGLAPFRELVRTIDANPNEGLEPMLAEYREKHDLKDRTANSIIGDRLPQCLLKAINETRSKYCFNALLESGVFDNVTNLQEFRDARDLFINT